MRKRTILIFFFVTIVLNLFAQETDKRFPPEKKTLPLAVIEEIDSKALSEKRALNIYLPQGYDPDSVATYPVIYLLDGSAHEDFPHIAGLVQFMNLYEIIPKSIVVGVANIDRYRDFSHPSTDPEDLKALPTSGGSAKFMDFIEKELKPFIQTNYKIKGKATLIGQSMGGLLATEVLFKRPHLFEAYLIVSPSLWWDKQSMINKADDYLKAHTTMEKKVFVSLGKEHPAMHEVADKLVAAMKNLDSKNLTLYYEPLLEEDHATILHRAAYRGLEMLHKQKK